jgi:hypothetical protein
MNSGASAGMGRTKDTSINEANEAKKDTINDEHITGQGKKGRTKDQQEPHDYRNLLKTKDHERNSHLAWNPDSRWSR